MGWLVTLMCIIFFTITADARQQGKAQKNDQFFPEPPEFILPVIAHQPDSPIEFVNVKLFHHIGGGGIETYQLRNRGSKAIRAYTIATVTSVGGGSKWIFEAKKSSEWIMPKQILPPSVDGSIKIVPLTEDLREEYQLKGSMKEVVIFIVVRVEYSDGSVYDAGPLYDALSKFFRKEPR